MGTGGRGVLRLALALCTALTCALGYEVDMVFQTRCMFEEINQPATQVTGSFGVFNRDDKTPILVTARVDDPEGRMMYETGQTRASSGSFQFTAQLEGDYKLCFTTEDYRSAQVARVQVQWLSGAAAKDWEQVAKRDNLNIIQTELLKLEDAVHDIHVELQQIRRKEERMRDINEATNARVAWFSIGVLVVCVALSCWQLWYLKKFFYRKKVL